jgi:hypothetical protein
MRRFALVSAVLVVACGCSSARSRSAPAAVASSAAPAPIGAIAAVATAATTRLPFAADPPRNRDGERGRDSVPLSIKRLLSEEQSEMRDVLVLAAPIGDARGRARAAAEVSVLADELRAIEASLRAPANDSDRLDEIVVKLHLLATRIGILHDALRVAAGPTTAVEIDVGATKP